MSAQPTPSASLRRRFVPALAGAVSALLAVSVVAGAPAGAAAGPAPESRTLKVLADVHTDAVATFFDDGKLVLDSKADTPSIGTRYDNEDVLFHVDDDSKYPSWPAGAPTFVAPQGSTVWLAPQTQAANQIWPGFSTEAVPRGTLVGDNTTLTLEDVDGPGDVELWQTGSFGSTTRLWSSDEDFKSFTRGNVHLHSNWAFTEPGTYRLTVRADAVLVATSAPVSDTAVYTFVVGEMAEDIDTTTMVTASESSLLAGDPVTFSSTVAPAGVKGSVEFRDGLTVLGHDEVDVEGASELVVPDLAVGTHAVTAVFTPAVENFANSSMSAPVSVAVTDSSGEPFSIRGVAESYEPGATLDARVVGVVLKEGQEIRWKIRYQGTTSTLIPPGRDTVYSQIIDANHDDAELQASLYDTVAKATLSETAWEPINVTHRGGQPVIEQVGTAPDPLFPGDSIDYKLTGRALSEGETVAWGFGTYGGYYAPGLSATNWPATYPTADKSSIHLTSRYNPAITGRYAPPLVATVIKDGVAVSRSEFTYLTTGRRELNVSGSRTLYREGAKVQLDATTYPARADDDFSYTWTFSRKVGETTTTEVWGTEKQATPALTGPVLTKQQHDKGSIKLTLFNKGVHAQVSPTIPINVTDDLSSQILEFSSLAEHYHQGDSANLQLTADPEPLTGDTLQWEWKFPGGDWSPMAGVVDNQWPFTAEQGLDGMEVRAKLTWADTSREPLVSATRVVHIDDHGSAARQKPTVSGGTSYREGQDVALSRELPDNGQTIFTTHLWERKLPGSDEWQAIDGQDSPALSLPAVVAEDRAQYRVSILKPGGAVAYGPSPAATVSVTKAQPPALVTPKITAASVQQTYGRTAKLSVSFTPAATGVVHVTVGSRKVAGKLTGGRVTVTLPAKALAPGTRTVAVAYAGVPGSFAPTSQNVKVVVGKATAKIQVKASKTVKRGRTAKFVVTATAPGVRPTGQVTVRVAGKSRTVRLNSAGKAVVRITIAKKTRLGKKSISVSYRGSTYVAAVKARPHTKITVKR